jgi:hypothetical protein
MVGLDSCESLFTDLTNTLYEGKRALVPAEEETVVTVLLERSFNGNHASKIGTLLRELRVLAMQQTGYVAGHTLLGEEDDDYFLVTNTWETWKSLEHWRDWCNNAERLELEAEVDGLLQKPIRVKFFT